MSNRFRLQRLLEFRARLEREQESATAHAHAMLVQAQEELITLQAAQQTARRQGATHSGVTVDLDNVLRTERYVEVLAHAITLQGERIHDFSAALQEEEALLRQRRQERRALEKLREQHDARVRTAEKHREIVTIDDLVMARQARRLLTGTRE